MNTVLVLQEVNTYIYSFIIAVSDAVIRLVCWLERIKNLRKLYITNDDYWQRFSWCLLLSRLWAILSVSSLSLQTIYTKAEMKDLISKISRISIVS